MCYTSKTFRKENYFVLYDDNDNIICYFDSVDELLNCVAYSLKKLVYRFNKEGNTIGIEINHKRYRLATFVD